MSSGIENPEPSGANDYLAGHVAILLGSYRDLTGRELLPVGDHPETAARLLYEAPFFVASHGLEDDPILNYGNLIAQELFEMDWEEFTRTPSRFTAEEPVRNIVRPVGSKQRSTKLLAPDSVTRTSSAPLV